MRAGRAGRSVGGMALRWGRLQSSGVAQPARAGVTARESTTGAWRGVHPPGLNAAGCAAGAQVVARRTAARSPELAKARAHTAPLSSLRSALRSVGTFAREKPVAFAFIIGPTKAMLCDTLVQYYIEGKDELDKKRTL